MNYNELKTGRTTLISGVTESYSPLLIANFFRESQGDLDLIYIARTAEQMESARQLIHFIDPGVEALTFPAWDCMPYDRVSPSSSIMCQRMGAISALIAGMGDSGRRLILTTVNAVIQKLPPKESIISGNLKISVGKKLKYSDLTEFLSNDGYSRTSSVREASEYAIRGGIIDVFPPSYDQPFRIDLFGERIETLRTFDPLSQITTGHIDNIQLVPASEVRYDQASINKFRENYQSHFGALSAKDPIFSALSEGRRHIGAEHWLPLFYDQLTSLVELLPKSIIVFAHGFDEDFNKRIQFIEENYSARCDAVDNGQLGAAYRPLQPELLTLTNKEWLGLIHKHPCAQLSPYDGGEIEFSTKPARSFVSERTKSTPQKGGIVLDAVIEHVHNLIGNGVRVVITAVSVGSRDRLSTLLIDHGLKELKQIRSLNDINNLPANVVAIALVDIGHGFESPDLAVLSEEDILGEKIVRRSKKSLNTDEFIRELSSLSTGDIVVHIDHGIGRFEGLETLTIQYQPHDCLIISYEGGDRLYLPVENIEVISRYGSGQNEVTLDRLGSASWQSRMSRARSRIKEIANDLLRVAASRKIYTASKLLARPSDLTEFCARFPFTETDDQDRTISEVLDDMASGNPMDRLVCGDVGFGKTEVALRSAFVAVMSGKQVALIAPTTLLVRQHMKTFSERFLGWPVVIGELSRMQKGNQTKKIKEGIKNGEIDIAIGTHSLLSEDVNFSDLGLLIIDEEQRFGVTHKEKLKEVGQDIHVLTLSATPIPRTLQMSLSGVRELSLIATPPVDRIAIRTFILPFDALVIREAMQREIQRGGQIFYVCPRIKDINGIQQFVRDNVEGAKIVTAHGQMKSSELEAAMTEFYDGKSNVLVSSNIIESGLDVPSANTLIIHRADMFGLSELYQLRGRVGRSKIRAYAYLTIPETRIPTPSAEKRLRVMQSLDGLGAGFSLASHDMDIRGAGNLLGAEQSGHIREVGFELYQKLLAESIKSIREKENDDVPELIEVWSPQINVNTSVLIPESYVIDLDTRLGLYRRIANLTYTEDIESFATELIDRFGPMPSEVDHLLKIVAIKRSLYKAGVEKLDAGHKGATFSFRNNSFVDPEGLVKFVSNSPIKTKFRADHSVVIFSDWAKSNDRLSGVKKIADDLAQIVLDYEEKQAGN